MKAEEIQEIINKYFTEPVEFEAIDGQFNSKMPMNAFEYRFKISEFKRNVKISKDVSEHGSAIERTLIELKRDFLLT